ncbi:3-isopropylmalate dehydratase small subunit [Silanimonas sp.]|jgi:3-isopropylmalate/(R)-2-methylmalate dehydratase small subunit|uniref:3-isopropylmalate dehydratase small subunit n=1 Tax=Silanimonas sp. TaxID=1929290 RepID=UPI0037C9AF73
MNPFRTLESPIVALPRANIDTDQIIPARFLTTTTREGLGRHAFHDWRYDEQGAPRPDFVLNRPEHRDARILVAGRNFGCGSSREHAPWALLDAGIRVVISSEIADIFRNNALKNGLLPIVLPEAVVDTLLAQPGLRLQVDVAKRRVYWPDGEHITFPLDAFAQTCLLEGVDELGYLLAQDAAITTFEERRHAA